MDRRSKLDGATFRELLGALMLQKRHRTNDELKLLDVVELLSDVSDPAPAPWGGAVKAGAIGSIVEVLSSDFYLVEFAGDDRSEPVIMTLPGSALALHLASRV